MPVFDQGYQHWKGRLSGHAWRWLAVTRHGVRIGMQGRWFRIVLIVSLLPAAVLAFVISVWGLIERKADLVAGIVNLLVTSQMMSPALAADPRHYRVIVWTLSYSLFLSLELTLSMILVLLVGPNLISQDLRFNALPLYLSRPLRRIDYLAGKLGVIATFLGLVIIVPCLVSYALGILFSLDFSILKDTYRVILAAVLYGVVIIVSAGMLILALSSLSRNSRYVALFWLGVWIVGNIVAASLEQVDATQRQQAAWQRQVAEQNAAQAKDEAPPAGRSGRNRRGPRFAPRYERMMNDFAKEENEAAKTNWRPLLSYTGNLARVGRSLLGTDDCWRTLSELQPESERDRFLMQWAGPQYPWTWSAGVLAGLLALSACILSLAVRSLDRMR